MKRSFYLTTFLLTCINWESKAQFRTMPGKEITVMRPWQPEQRSSFHTTAAYNDIFDPPKQGGLFLLPEMSFYKEKKVAAIHIFDVRDQLQYAVDIDKEGLITKKTATGFSVRTEETCFYDEARNPLLTVRIFFRKDGIARTDSMFYTYKTTTAGDTIYTYTIQQTRSYKTGRFLNQQNEYYNQKYYNRQMPASWAFQMPNAGATQAGTIYLPTRLASDYEPGQFYFSRQQTEVPAYKVTLHQQQINPGASSLQRYIPELALRLLPEYSSLPCEQFREPRFIEQIFTCGTGAQYAAQFDQMHRSAYYTYSRNTQDLQDTCYLNIYNKPQPSYYFQYQFHP